MDCAHDGHLISFAEQLNSFFSLIQQLQHTTHLDQPNPHYPSCSPHYWWAAGDLLSAQSRPTQGHWSWQAQRQGAQRLVQSVGWGSDQTASAPSGFWLCLQPVEGIHQHLITKKTHVKDLKVYKSYRLLDTDIKHLDSVPPHTRILFMDHAASPLWPSGPFNTGFLDKDSFYRTDHNRYFQMILHPVSWF